MVRSWVQNKEAHAIPKHLYNLICDLTSLVERVWKKSFRIGTYYSKIPNRGTAGPAAEALSDRKCSGKDIIVCCRQCVLRWGIESASDRDVDDFMSNEFDMVRCARRAPYRI